LNVLESDAGLQRTYVDSALHLIDGVATEESFKGDDLFDGNRGSTVVYYEMTCEDLLPCWLGEMVTADQIKSVSMTSSTASRDAFYSIRIILQSCGYWNDIAATCGLRQERHGGDGERH
jgi:hypothetical protein